MMFSSSEVVKAAFLGGFVSVFFIVNLVNASRILLSSGQRSSRIERETFKGNRVRSIQLTIAGFGTVTYFAVIVVYCISVFVGLFELLSAWTVDLHPTLSVCSDVVGATFIAVGCFIFLWSILERGRRSNLNKLVTWGAFRYIRHPSYAGYFLMFTGLVLLLRHPMALLPLVAIPGYVGLATFEEQMLIEEFGEPYLKYQRRTGRFLPKRRSPRTDVSEAD
ncbi:MAG: isoprenylcysteine carboxylmethyltransferase family protein [Candidatus Bathyarchaeota archaeon]|nr:MAG: isoprenylcysteine carboxylmethyltransferase family protein [Candidatus Bathyarchaeota archaeon]